MIKRLAIIASVCVLAATMGVAYYLDNTGDSTGEVQPTVDSQQPLSVELTPFEEEVTLVKEPVVALAKGERSAAQLYKWYRSQYGHLDEPVPVRISFWVSGVPATALIQEQTVEISESETFEKVTRYTVDVGDNQLLVYNLKTDTHYYFRVTVQLTNGESASASGAFTTTDTPRFLLVDGLRNVRDIGGYQTVDGKTVKSGMFYRGTELRGTMSDSYELTEAGEAVLINDLGVKTELDLRRDKESGDPLDGVERKNYRLFATYSEIFTQDDAPIAIKNLFSDLANEENYPVYMHCTWGRDRTGTMVYLLQGLLGVSEEDCYTEWELSIFFSGASMEAEMTQFAESIRSLEGDTFQEKVETYLLDVGVTRKQMDEIRRIMLTEE